MIILSMRLNYSSADGFDWLFGVRSGVQPVGVEVSIADTFTSNLIPRLGETLKTSSRPIKALVLTNPQNPFGQCYPKHVIEECILFCNEHDIHFISDEVYAMSSFKNKQSATLVPFTSALSIDVKAVGGNPARVHVVWSISKDFGSSGFRMVSCQSPPPPPSIGTSEESGVDR